MVRRATVGDRPALPLVPSGLWPFVEEVVRVIAAVRSATLFGVEGHPVTVEVHVSTGLPAFQIVGLPDEACRESRDRVRAAMLSSELEWPSSRVTVNLAPTSRRDRKSTRLNSSHIPLSRMPSSA